MVKAENVYKTFYTTHKIEALVDVSCKVEKGEVVVIIGPSGSGKSTILRCLNMLEKADSGHIYIDGVDILDPLQAAADGMEPQALKEAYGDRICLHGGICTQYLLPRGTPDEVRREVRRRLEILADGGGYILAPCHVLQTDVPTENILAMSDTCVEFGRSWQGS